MCEWKAKIFFDKEVYWKLQCFLVSKTEQSSCLQENYKGHGQAFKQLQI